VLPLPYTKQPANTGAHHASQAAQQQQQRNVMGGICGSSLQRPEGGKLTASGHKEQKIKPKNELPSFEVMQSGAGADIKNQARVCADRHKLDASRCLQFTLCDNDTALIKWLRRFPMKDIQALLLLKSPRQLLLPLNKQHRMSIESIQQLADRIYETKQLVCFRMNGQSINMNRAEILAPALAEVPGLERVDLMSNRIDTRVVRWPLSLSLCVCAFVFLLRFCLV
jgi:hypothetical protein